jgi:hypothetical protein
MSLVYIMWLPVDEYGNELVLPDDEFLEDGEGYVVPSVGDTVMLLKRDWLVVSRFWINATINKRAMVPSQSVTLHILEKK